MRLFIVWLRLLGFFCLVFLVFVLVLFWLIFFWLFWWRCLRWWGGIFRIRVMIMRWLSIWWRGWRWWWGLGFYLRGRWLIFLRICVYSSMCILRVRYFVILFFLKYFIDVEFGLNLILFGLMVNKLIIINFNFRLKGCID